MTSFPSESELVAALDRADTLVRLCAAGSLSFPDFCLAYDNFYQSFPLDSHESDEAGLAALAKHADRIAPHQVIAENILSKVCSDADAATESYRVAARFGSVEAVARLKLVAVGLSGGEA